MLSAGASNRMGQPKALLQVPGGAGTFVERIAGTLAEAPVERIVVVIGPPHGEAIRAAHRDLQVSWAWNDDPRRGMLSSLQVGLRLCGECAGVLVWPVDIPLVSQATVRRVIDAGLGGPGPVVPTHGGRGGHPIWLPARLFQEAIGYPVESGLRGLLGDRRAEVVRFPVEDPDILRDFDTPADMEAARTGALKSR